MNDVRTDQIRKEERYRIILGSDLPYTSTPVWFIFKLFGIVTLLQLVNVSSSSYLLLVPFISFKQLTV